MGFGQGLIEGDQFVQQQEMGKLALAEGKVKLQSEEITLAQTKKMLEIQQQVADKIKTLNVSGGPGGTTGADSVVESRAAMLDAMGDFYGPSFPQEAGKLYTDASNLRKHQAEIEGKLQEQKGKDMTMVADLLGNVHDFKGLQGSIQIALMQSPHLAEQYKEFLTHIQNAQQMPNGQINVNGHVWNVAELTQKLKDAAISQKEQADAAQAAAGAKMHDAQAKLDAATIPLREQEARHQKALADEEVRAGKVPKVLTGAQLQAITDQARHDYPNATQEELRKRAAAATEDMLDFMKDGVPESEAKTRAYQRASARGDFTGLTKRSELPGETAEKPMPVPKGSKLGGLKDNKWYNIGGVARIKIDNEWWTQEELEHRRATDDE